MNIVKYYNKKGETRYKYNAYLGINPLTGKEKRTNRQGFRTKREAEQDYINLIAGNTKTRNVTSFESVYNAWREIYDTTVKSSTVRLVAQIFDTHILPVFGKAQIQRITYTDLQNFINKKAYELKDFNKLIVYMRLVFKHAMRLGIVNANPCELIIRPKINHKTRNSPTWNIEDVKKFIEYTKTDLPFQWHVFFYLIVITGMRRGEAMALHWEDIDEDIIKIRRTISRGVNGIATDTPKTKSSIRDVVIDEYAISALHELKIVQYSSFGDLDMVFNNSKGTYISTSFPLEKLNYVIKKRGLPYMTIHGLRHTNASILYFNGNRSKIIQERLGHASDTVTLNTYTHTPLNEQRMTMNDFSKVLHHK